MVIKKFIQIILFAFLPNLILSQVSLNASLSKAVNIQVNGQIIGSGFYYMSDSFFFLVTAAHVIYETDTLIGKASDKLSFDSIDIVSYDKIQSIDRSSFLSAKLIKNTSVWKHDKKDICVVLLGKLMNFNDSENVSINTYTYVTIKRKAAKLNGFLNVKSLHMDKLTQGSEVRILGYPTSLNDSKRIGEKIYEFEFPLLQTGIISGISNKIGNIIISGAVFYGNSGGAVLSKSEDVHFDKKGNMLFIDNYYLIGVVSELIPFGLRSKAKDKYYYSNSGYSVVIPIQYADEIIKRIK